LREVAAFKILKQVSRVYSTATFAFLEKVIPFMDNSSIERLVVLCGKKTLIQVRLHHRTNSVEFGLNDSSTDVSDTSSTPTVTTNQTVSASTGTASEPIRQHLQHMYKALGDAASTIDEKRAVILKESMRHQITLYGYHKNDQHKALLERKRRIELYKETNERIKFDNEEKQKEQLRRENAEKQKLIESKLQKEMKERQEQQKQKEQEDLQKRIMQDRLDKMKDPKLRKLIENLPEEELKHLDHDLILQKQISHLEKEKKEHMNRLKQQEKKWDYFVRAMHLEEVELRQHEYDKWAVDDKDEWEMLESERIERALVEHELLVKTVDRIKCIKEAEEVICRIRGTRSADFRKSVIDWEKTLASTRLKRLQDRKDERKKSRRAEWLTLQKEAERKKKEEEDRQKREQENASRKTTGYQRRGPEPTPGQGADADTWEKKQLPQDSRVRQQQWRPDANEDSGSRDTNGNWRRDKSDNPPIAAAGTTSDYGRQGSAMPTVNRIQDDIDWKVKKSVVPEGYRQGPIAVRDTDELWRRQEPSMPAPWTRNTNRPPASGGADSASWSRSMHRPPASGGGDPTAWSRSTHRPPASGGADAASWSRNTYRPPASGGGDPTAWSRNTHRPPASGGADSASWSRNTHRPPASGGVDEGNWRN